MDKMRSMCAARLAAPYGKFVSTIVIAAVSLTISFAGLSHAAITNGFFDDDLSVGWSYSGEVQRLDDAEGTRAWLSTENSTGGSLWQTFAVDAPTLSFDVLLASEGAPDSDEFRAYLSSGSEFYFLDNSGLETYDPEQVTVTDLGGDWKRVTLNDISSLMGGQAALKFELLNDDEIITWVFIDNVLPVGSTAVIPAPAALSLAAMGMGLIGLLRRSKILR